MVIVDENDDADDAVQVVHASTTTKPRPSSTDDSHARRAPLQQVRGQPHRPSDDAHGHAKRVRVDEAPVGQDGSGSGEWACSMCTFVNPATFLMCGACGTAVHIDGENVGLT